MDTRLCGDRTAVYSLVFIAFSYYLIFHYSKHVNNVFFSSKQVKKRKINLKQQHTPESTGAKLVFDTVSMNLNTTKLVFTTSIPIKIQPKTEEDFIKKLVRQQSAKAAIQKADLDRKNLEKYRHENAPIILANSLGWDDRKMHGPPNGLETCPEEYRNCTIDTEIIPSRWNRIRLGIFQFDKSPPFTKEVVEYWNRKNHFVAQMPSLVNLTKNWETQDFPWAFLSYETPQFHREDSRLNYTTKRGLYNYTMTYRLDSDIPNPFGTVYSTKLSFKNEMLQKLKKKRVEADFMDGDLERKYDQINEADVHTVFKVADGRDIFSEKVNGVFSVVSNCKSSYRQTILKKFADGIKFKNGSAAIDLKGRCGKKLDTKLNLKKRREKRSPYGDYSKTDFETVLPTYKFYLAIENSRCSDYITEKFWHHCIKSEVVCIVGGTSRKNYERLIDGSSFIHVEDFGDSVEGLDKIIKLVNDLLEDSVGYNRFFEWRNKSPPFDYEYGTFEEYKATGICKACKIAMEEEDMMNGVNFGVSRVIDDLGKWWFTKPFSKGGIDVCIKNSY